MARPKKRKDEAVPKADIPKAYRKAQAGFTWVFNRSKEPFTIVFEAAPETWEGYEYRMVEDDLAKFCNRRGVIKWDPAGQHTVLALVDMRHKYYGIPLTEAEEKRGTEVLVRTKAGNVETDVEETKVD